MLMSVPAAFEVFSSPDRTTYCNLSFPELLGLSNQSLSQGRAQAVRRAAALVLSQVRSCGIFGGQGGIWVGFLLHIYPSSGAGTIGPPVADVPGGVSPNRADEFNKKFWEELFAYFP
jgi:hypothetical protein